MEHEGRSLKKWFAPGWAAAGWVVKIRDGGPRKRYSRIGSGRFWRVSHEGGVA